MSVLLSSCCCTTADPCESDWNFFDCCSGRRIFDHPVFDLPPYQEESLGVQVNLTRVPAGPYIGPSTSSNYRIQYDSIPSAFTAVGGRLNYGEPAPNNYDYFGAKAGNWGPPTGSGNEFIRESLLRAYGAQFPNSWQAATWKRFRDPQDSIDDILNGAVSPIETGSFDRLELIMRGPVSCTGGGCHKIGYGSIRLSSSTGFGPEDFGVTFQFNRGTTRDGGLNLDCDPVTGTWPSYCAQCPQDLSPMTELQNTPQSFIKGNRCGIPADIHALLEAQDPGSISNSWSQRANFCSGSDYYFGGCEQGWYGPDCEDVQSTFYGTVYAGYGECSCCPSYDWDDKEVSLQVIT